MSEHVLRLEENRRGRDLVMGDLHGQFPTLMRLLEKIRFDPAQDRLISVGDLIDRGPDSPSCLGLLDEPWFYAIRGNHEQMMVESALGASQGRRPNTDGVMHVWATNGGFWAFDDDPSQVYVDVVWDRWQQVRSLPLALVVGQGRRRFNVVHAEFPEAVDDGVLDYNPATIDAHAEHLLWSRSLMGSKRIDARRARDGLSTTFCGHTVHPVPVVRDSHVCLDTGAGAGLLLSICDVAEGRVYGVGVRSGRFFVRDILLPSSR